MNQTSKNTANIDVLFQDLCTLRGRVTMLENIHKVEAPSTSHNKQSTPCQHPFVMYRNPDDGTRICTDCGESV